MHLAQLGCAALWSASCLTSFVCLQVDGTQSMEEVFNSIDKHLTKLAESRSHHDAVAA